MGDMLEHDCTWEEAKRKIDERLPGWKEETGDIDWACMDGYYETVTHIYVFL